MFLVKHIDILQNVTNFFFKINKIFFNKILFYTAQYFNQPEQFKGDEPTLDPFAQVGPPHNLTVAEATDGYLITWDAPVYGTDSLRVYMLRWYLEPEHQILGSVPTVYQYHVLKGLEEGNVYSIRVSALSMDDYEADGLEIELVVPAHKRMKAIAIGTMTAVIFLVIVLVIFIYTRRRWFIHMADSDSNIKVAK